MKIKFEKEINFRKIIRIVYYLGFFVSVTYGLVTFNFDSALIGMLISMVGLNAMDIDELKEYL